MIDACKEQGLPEPKFEEYLGFRVIFRKDICTKEYLKNLGLNERQINAVMFVKKEGGINNKKYQKLFNVSKKTASRELTELVTKKIFERKGLQAKEHFTPYGVKGVTKGFPFNSSDFLLTVKNILKKWNRDRKALCTKFTGIIIHGLQNVVHMG